MFMKLNRRQKCFIARSYTLEEWNYLSCNEAFCALLEIASTDDVNLVFATADSLLEKQNPVSRN